MENSRLKLPAGIQTFETIRTESYVYVDKTKYLVDLINSGKIYFLARPRRFGKSLTISTFDALFSGKKELFKGLYAEGFLNRPEFVPSPVIRLDMSGVTNDCGIDTMAESLKLQVLRKADSLDIEIATHHSVGDVFDELIAKAVKKYASKVVVLIDEYDKPFTDFIDDTDMAERVRTLLRSFYSRLKVNEEHIRFIFLTGISKFTKMGVFSTLNNLTDISLLEKYGNICGYSETEIIDCFPDYLDETANEHGITTEELVKKMKKYYNGFCFDTSGKNRLYNPFSTLQFFFSKQFFNFWVESGSMSMIAKYLKTQNLTVEQFRNFPVSVDFLTNSVEIDKAPPESFLYQTGYLTLRQGTSRDLSLDYPNTEVLNSMSSLISQNILYDNNDNFTYCSNDLLKGLMTLNCDKVISSFNRLLASIPYDDFTAAARQNISDNDYDFKPQEWLYRSTILAFLRGCGVVVFAEMHTNLGRADLVVSHKGKTWIIEIKVAYEGENPAKKAKEALRQIIDKNYAAPYPDAFCVGMAIDDTVRAITNHEFLNN
jgi:hypothetical protein